MAPLERGIGQHHVVEALLVEALGQGRKGWDGGLWDCVLQILVGKALAWRGRSHGRFQRGTVGFLNHPDRPLPFPCRENSTRPGPRMVSRSALTSLWGLMR